jgi:hypothetical protein
MMLINHISNLHSNIFSKNNCIFFYFSKLFKLVQIGESKWIIEYSPFQDDVALKCTCKFSMFKYHNKVHQNFNEKVGLNSIWPIIFKHTCYLHLLCQKISNFVIILL